LFSDTGKGFSKTVFEITNYSTAPSGRARRGARGRTGAHGVRGNIFLLIQFVFSPFPIKEIVSRIRGKVSPKKFLKLLTTPRHPAGARGTPRRHGGTQRGGAGRALKKTIEMTYWTILIQ